MTKPKEVQTTTPVKKRVPNPTGIGGFQERPQDRNPGGNPRTDISIKKKLIERLEADDGASLAKIAMARANSGDFKFWKEIKDMIDGPIVSKTELTGKDGGALEVVDSTDKERNEIFSEFVKITKDIYGRKNTPNTE